MFLSAATGLSVVEVDERLGDQSVVYVAPPVCCSISSYSSLFSFLFVPSLPFFCLVLFFFFILVFVSHFTPFCRIFLFVPLFFIFIERFDVVKLGRDYFVAMAGSIGD